MQKAWLQSRWSLSPGYVLPTFSTLDSCKLQSVSAQTSKAAVALANVSAPSQ